MAGPLSILSIVPYDLKINDFKTFFVCALDFQTVYHDVINNYIVY